jgi:hypothetical protein
MTPAKTKTEGQWNYMMAFYGCLWKIFVSRQSAPVSDTCALKSNGTILMPVIDYDKVPMIRQVMGPATVDSTKGRRGWHTGLAVCA